MTKIIFFLCCLFFTFSPLQAGVNEQLRKGGHYYNQQKYGSALETYQQILKHSPKDQNAWFNAGNAYYRLNEYTQAQEAYKQAEELKGPQNQNALFNAGNAYYRAGDKQKAIEQYKAAILVNPQDKEAIHNLQLLLQEQDQQKQKDQNNNNQDNHSDNQNQQQDNNQGQAPQQASPQKKPGQLDKNDADRVMAMAKEQKYKQAAGNTAPEKMVDKDW